MPNNSNPVITTYRGVPIRKYPRINIRVSVYEMKKFIDAEKDFGLSAKEAIKDKKILCPDTPSRKMN